MTARVHYAGERPVNPLAGRRLAVLGYGSQGRAQALNLRDSGFDVRIGLRPDSPSADRAADDGLPVRTVRDACAETDVVVLLLPDTKAPAVYAEAVRPELRDGNALVFAHGFNIRFAQIVAPPYVDVVMVAPKAPGRDVREMFTRGAGCPALVAVEHDASGAAWSLALGYADAIGATRAGALRTTFAEETETDLFGEQAVLVGGVCALVRSGFEVLVEAGYQPESAYLECLHELKLVVDLIQLHGLAGMHDYISDTAEYGDYSRAARVIDGSVRDRMRELLAGIRSGSFAADWMAEDRAGRPRFRRARAAAAAHPIEEVGARLRAMMPFLSAPQG